MAPFSEGCVCARCWRARLPLLPARFGPLRGFASKPRGDSGPQARPPHPLPSVCPGTYLHCCCCPRARWRRGPWCFPASCRSAAQAPSLSHAGRAAGAAWAGHLRRADSWRARPPVLSAAPRSSGSAPEAPGRRVLERAHRHSAAHVGRARAPYCGGGGRGPRAASPCAAARAPAAPPPAGPEAPLRSPRRAPDSAPEAAPPAGLAGCPVRGHRPGSGRDAEPDFCSPPARHRGRARTQGRAGAAMWASAGSPVPAPLSSGAAPRPLAPLVLQNRFNFQTVLVLGRFHKVRQIWSLNVDSGYWGHELAGSRSTVSLRSLRAKRPCRTLPRRFTNEVPVSFAQQFGFPCIWDKIGTCLAGYD